MNALNRVYQEAQSVEDYARGYLAHLVDLFGKIDFKSIEVVIEVFKEAWQKGQTIFFVGNGGSASTASHFAIDFGQVNRYQDTGRFKVLGLTDNNAVVTALANDFSYEDIFVEQMKNLFEGGDVLVGISASGNSSNVIKAMKLAEKRGGVTVGLVGFDGGIIKKTCQYSIHIETAQGEYGPVEDLHLILDHLISTYLVYVLEEKEQKKELVGNSL